jgi:hypothetical protein
MTGWSNPSVTARRSAVAPSITTRIGRVTSSPRSRSPASTSVTTVVFSVAPSAKGERELGAVDGDAQGDHTGVLGHPDAVHQQRHQIEGGQVLGEQLGQGVLGPGDEPARDRRLGGPEAVDATPVPTGSSPAG